MIPCRIEIEEPANVFISSVHVIYTWITTGSAIFQEPGAQRGVRACAEREQDARAPWSARERADRGRRATASCARGCALAVARAMAVGMQAVGAEASSTIFNTHLLQVIASDQDR